ncbi:MAG: hypothetical protein ACE365_00925 [Gammaproteobacteria bacterium]
MFMRIFDLRLPEKQSAFLWGARKMGKSRYLKQPIFIFNRGEVAVEIKVSDQISKQHLKKLVAFSQENKPKFAIIVSLEPGRRKITVEGGTDFISMHWRGFLDGLWQGKILS